MVVNLETIIDMPWWYRTWPLNGFNVSYCKPRNNHRYAVVVQDLATQLIQSYPETERSLQKFVEPSRKPIVIYPDNSLEFGKACEDISWNHCTSTPHRSETNVIAERAVRRIKAGTSAVFFCSLVWMKNGFPGMLLLFAKNSRQSV